MYEMVCCGCVYLESSFSLNVYLLFCTGNFTSVTSARAMSVVLLSLDGGLRIVFFST